MKFNVGQHYETSNWFTGGWMEFDVKKVRNDSVTFQVTDYEMDGKCIRTEMFPIKKDNDGNEYIVIQTDYEYEHQIWAKEVE